MIPAKQWIEEKIKNGYIRYFEYDKFNQIAEIDSGGFSIVSKANLVNTGLVALKILNSNKELDEANNEFVKELEILREIDYHPNINRILGITKDSENYIFVLEYANEGNLRDYLKKKVTYLNWNDKIRMALDISNGLRFLHYKGIIHRDLNSKNILVNNEKLLIADFGISKKLAEVTSNSMGNALGMAEYIDPQCFKQDRYKKDKKSDIYSLGVLLWEISSGHPPFLDNPRNVLCFQINYNNLREEPIEGTPLKYQKLYQECWNSEPNSRPDIEEVYEILSQLKTDSVDLQSPHLNIPRLDIEKVYEILNKDKPNLKKEDWLEKLISEEFITYYDYSKFEMIQKIGKGSSASVCRASWKNTDQIVALKSFNYKLATLKQFVNEIKLHKKVDFHENIIRLYGITTVENTNAIKKWALVLEYADSGTLETYLHNCFYELGWDDKYQLALQLASAVACLHEFGIIHRDLHASNILIHRKKLKLADFGLSKKISASSNNQKIFGVIPYIDPKKLNDNDYKLDKKSDVYSVGVLMWQISSGYKPYRSDNYDMNLLVSIMNGKREEIIDGTPTEYKCWNYEPDERPNMQDIVSTLKALITSKQDANFDIEKNIPSGEYESTSNSNKGTIDVHNDLNDLSSLLVGSIDGTSSISECDSLKIEVAPEILSQNLNSSIRNLLIVGCAGSGKTTLSNILSNTIDFEESKYSKNFRKQIFEWEGIKYHVIDDIGMGNIMLTDKQSMYEKMSEIVYLMPEGISQVLFVIDGKFSAVEESTFNLLDFASGITEYITIVRTKFNNFKNEHECKKDKDDLCKNETIAKLCKSIVHIDNPPINIIINDEDDEETIIVNKKRRYLSRTILLDHLSKVIPEKNYRLKFLDLLLNESTVENIANELNRSLDSGFNGINKIKVGIRNLIIVGRANSGKSTIAEILSDSHYFEEDTGEIKKKYNVTDAGVIKPIKNIIKLSKKIEEICQILFVIDGKLMADEVEAIFDNEIHEHITIVRTKFSNFKNEDKCKKEKEDLCKQNEAVAKICQNIVYVDNPPINIHIEDEDDEATVTLNRKRRDLSRTILLDHLNKVFQEKVYRLKVYDKLRNNIAAESITEVERNSKLEIPERVKYIKKFFTNLTKKFTNKSTNIKGGKEKIKYLIIIGRALSGKSTLFNVLYDIKYPKKNEYKISEVGNLQGGTFRWNGTKYYVIEIGVEPIKVFYNDIMESMLDLMSEGISQILFVVNERFTAEEKTTFELYKKIIFETGILEYVTIVRNKFSNFGNKNECERDKICLFYENEIIAEIVNSCKGIVHVDNPPIDIVDDNEGQIDFNRDIRKKSRIILLNYLEEVCQEKYYKWENLYSKISSYTNSDSDVNSINSTLAKILTQNSTYNIMKVAMKGLKFVKSNQQVIKHLKLNHGLLLDRCNIKPSKQAIFIDGELSINSYDGNPIVYADINKSTELCINFPIAEVTYTGGMSKSFSKYINNENLHDLYGHYFASKTLIGGKLFIKSLNLVTSAQMDMLKYYLFYVYNLAKCSIKVQFNNLFTLNLLPKVATMDGEELDTHEKFSKWINNLYQKHQKKVVFIISYNNLIPISQLRNGTTDNVENYIERQPGIFEFKEKLSLADWVGNAAYDNLFNWTKNFLLFQGFIITKNYEIEISKKIAVDFIKIPKIISSDKSYLKMIRPSTNLEIGLISSNIFSIKNLSSFPIFPIIKGDVESYKDFYYILIKFEHYEIILDENNVKPTNEFEQIIEKALSSMRPLKELHRIFNEYGHLFSQRVILGRSLKVILPDSSSYKELDNVNDINVMLKSLDNLNVSYLLTQKGESIEKDDLSDWIKDTNDNLEVIEFDNIIPLYKILKIEQQKKIDDILDKFNDLQNFRIIMTGITDLKDLDNNDDLMHYKRIDIETSLEDENYEVFGSIISKNYSKLDNIYINFGLYDFNGFYAIIKKSKITNIDLKNCYVSWMIVGKPSQLSVFSPNNRDFQVNYFKKLIKLRSDQFNYQIETSFSLSEGCTIFAHAYHSSTNYEPNTIIKLIKWTKNSINFQITNLSKLDLNDDDFATEAENVIDIDLNICVLFTDYKNLKIDNKKEEKCLIFGYILTKENFDENLDNSVEDE
ncbi:hypothetical protein RclHR1_09420003 [Rhizophagus clarus]|uniref:Protein kinase domain-containing protein n=1 Tax=Rhizophagus clarus TaxID=94130 RepID=A0A2Z6SEN4_9GLOM|nr:hypothetical protein RclHR1_09420003 [Rhizophagus clarus]